jgi:4-hydroxyphenylpyruvate dioxygenase-like putative hemolysin
VNVEQQLQQALQAASRTEQEDLCRQADAAVLLAQRALTAFHRHRDVHGPLCESLDFAGVAMLALATDKVLKQC